MKKKVYMDYTSEAWCFNQFYFEKALKPLSYYNIFNFTKDKPCIVYSFGPGQYPLPDLLIMCIVLKACGTAVKWRLVDPLYEEDEQIRAQTQQMLGEILPMEIEYELLPALSLEDAQQCVPDVVMAFNLCFVGADGPGLQAIRLHHAKIAEAWFRANPFVISIGANAGTCEKREFDLLLEWYCALSDCDC